MAAQKQDDQHERTFSSYVRIRDVVLKTYLGRWTIGRSGERGSGISVLPARYDDDDDIYNVIRRKLKPGWIVIINLFRRRILLYSPSRQMTFYIFDWRLRNRKYGITVHMCIDLYDSSWILYINNPHPLSSDTDWILLIYIYIYITYSAIRRKFNPS